MGNDRNLQFMISSLYVPSEFRATDGYRWRTADRLPFGIWWL